MPFAGALAWYCSPDAIALRNRVVLSGFTKLGYSLEIFLIFDNLVELLRNFLFVPGLTMEPCSQPADQMLAIQKLRICFSRRAARI